MTLLDVIALLDATIRTSTPLVLAALAGLFAERAGLVDIGLEGKMLAAAFASAAMAAGTGSAWAGLGMGVVVSVVLALLHGYASITHRGNQVVSGLAINILASGLTVTLGIAWYQRGGQTPPLEGDARFQQIALPFADTLRDVPVIGPIWSELISGHQVLVYAAFLAVPLVSWIVYRTRFGLRLRAVGENPAAVDTAGISVTALRYQALILTGILCGLAGTYLSVAQNASFGRDMTAGKGYLALAALIFAKWKPWPVMLTCLLFGLLDALEARLQGTVIPGFGEVPVQLIQALPYILTVVLLAGFIGRATAPKASGVPYVKER
ncbi:ABC transporter permease [Inquilinus limosus]|uniref:Sugar ABC transporter permease n=1 Tax=Inquilinus limosus TaxID=171674 RepID=A0A211ZLR6_9PROT|nr:ABC transporter permease [Inquilinus limosus]OWJ66027.1 sugar ABC transporter permease [Inquilinus limosus]